MMAKTACRAYGAEVNGRGKGACGGARWPRGRLNFRQVKRDALGSAIRAGFDVYVGHIERLLSGFSIAPYDVVHGVSVLVQSCEGVSSGRMDTRTLPHTRPGRVTQQKATAMPLEYL